MTSISHWQRQQNDYIDAKRLRTLEGAHRTAMFLLVFSIALRLGVPNYWLVAILLIQALGLWLSLKTTKDTRV